MLATLILAAIATGFQHPAPPPSPSPSLLPSVTPTPSPTQGASPNTEPTAPSPEYSAVLADADAHFARRAVLMLDDIADKKEIEFAIDLYRKAHASSPRDIVTLAKLLRALHFLGAYTGADVPTKKAIFEAGRELGQAMVDQLEADVKAARGMSRVESLRLVKGAPALFIWTAAHWGEWALVRGKFAAARNGVAGRVRDLAQTVVDLDPAFEGAVGYRILGRLHSEAPRIPFITGWVSHEKGVQYLRRAMATAPEHPVTCYFLADAILEHQTERRDEALRLLDQCIAMAPRPETLMEDAHYTKLARRLLERTRGPAAP